MLNMILSYTVVFITLGILLFLILVSFVLAILLHHLMFGKRWMPDGITKYYEVEDFEGFQKKPVYFDRKGVTLRGYIYSYEAKQYKGIMVFAHGMWGSHKAYVQEMEVFAKDGFLVLGFDYCGTDLSDGKSIQGLGESLKSLDYAIRYVKEDPSFSSLDIYVFGHSWGGYASSAIAKYHPDIKKIITMSPFTSVKRVVMSILPKRLWILIPFLMCVELCHCGKYSIVKTYKVLEKTTSDTLLIHSKDDPMVKYSKHTAYIQKKIKNPKLHYLILEDRLHNPDYSLESVQALQEYSTKVHSLPKDQVEEYRKTVDYHSLGNLDSAIIEEMLAFINH